ncbi:MAG: hypothetical protein VX904_12065 [Planctomycetota bacterium]|nr:hypothetical protein [Planctomycetota bacterium]
MSRGILIGPMIDQPGNVMAEFLQSLKDVVLSLVQLLEELFVLDWVHNHQYLDL